MSDLTLHGDMTAPLRRCERCMIVLRGQWWFDGLRILCGKCARPTPPGEER